MQALLIAQQTPVARIVDAAQGESWVEGSLARARFGMALGHESL
jgi:hypothetical protein